MSGVNTRREASQPGIDFTEAVRFWILLGFINFGGPAGQIALMHRELVERRKWVGELTFGRALGFCMALPGPEAQQLAIYLGWALHGIPGGIIAGTAFIGPSVVAMLLLSWMAVAHGDIVAVAGTLSGLQAMVVGIVADAVIRVGYRTLRGPLRVAIATTSFAATAFLGLPFPFVIGVAAVAGVVAGWLTPNWFPFPDARTVPRIDQPAFVVTPMREAQDRIWKVIGTTLILWIIPVGGIALWRGPDDILTRIALFFTRVSFFTFGGAYAVLSHVADEVVNDYKWVDASRMVQGLGLAESTPGPLIMVTQFVGFAAAYGQAPGLSPLVAGLLGGLLTTWCTFLPSFLFVLSGAPFVERLSGNPVIGAALMGITSAVVGAIANLSLYTTSHTIWPTGDRPDWFAVTVAVLTFVTLRRYSLPTYILAPVGAVAGILWSFVRSA
ncbi:MAG: chromate efflux transporter [Chloroflexi bacterium]|nr:chromate efflux transporter [Chloroflexota bacterium]